GMPVVEFLKKRIFTRVGMASVANIDDAALGPSEPMRYLRYALGPVREAPKEGAGWLFAAGELAMTASDLALWDISTIDQTILKTSSYRTMQTNTLLTNGLATNYGLGVQVGLLGGPRILSPARQLPAFTAPHPIRPDQRAAVVVLTNLDGTNASSGLAEKIATLLFRAAATDRDAAALAQAKAIFDALQHGRIDRTLFTSNANAYFSEAALADFASGL